MDNLATKISTTPIVIKTQDKVLEIDKNKPLWFTPQSDDIQGEEMATYAQIIAQKGQTSIGNQAIITYAQIGYDNEYEKSEGYYLVASPIEHYFTYKVFIKEDYEDALIDLYIYCQENLDKYKEIMNAIDTTFLIASKNGVTLDKNIISEKIRERIKPQLVESIQYFKDMTDDFTSRDQYTDMILADLLDLYSNPLPFAMFSIIDTAIAIEEYTNNHPEECKPMSWGNAIHFMLDKQSPDLASHIVELGTKRIRVERLKKIQDN